MTSLCFCYCPHKRGLQSSCLLHCSVRVNWTVLEALNVFKQCNPDWKPAFFLTIIIIWLFWGWDIFHSASLFHCQPIYVTSTKGPPKWAEWTTTRAAFSTSQSKCMGSICCRYQYTRCWCIVCTWLCIPQVGIKSLILSVWCALNGFCWCMNMTSLYN